MRTTTMMMVVVALQSCLCWLVVMRKEGVKVTLQGLLDTR